MCTTGNNAHITDTRDGCSVKTYASFVSKKIQLFSSYLWVVFHTSDVVPGKLNK